MDLTAKPLGRLRRLSEESLLLIRQATGVSLDLFKILVPILILIKLGEDAGLVEQFAVFCEPLMQALSLPGETAIVFATGMFTNLYGAVAVMGSLGVYEHLSAAQMTVLCSMMLICHALPTEVAICHKVGARFSLILPLRLVSAVVYGLILSVFYKLSGFSAEAAIWTYPEMPTQSVSLTWFEWTAAQFWNLIFIFAVILLIMTVMRLLTLSGLIARLERLLAPLMSVSGISPSASPLALVGLLVGITFGSGLLLAEVKKASISKRDVILTLVFLSLCHGIIEDSGVMLLAGADFVAIVLGRLLFTLIIVSSFSSFVFKRDSNEPLTREGASV